jgi:hypothetical protein
MRLKNILYRLYLLTITVAPLRVLLMITLLGIVGCAQIAPAQLPPRLVDQQDNLLPTLSAPFTITHNTYANSAFSAMYPDGWRVVSSAEFAEPSAVFVSPDETQIILITTKANDTLSAPDNTVAYDQISRQKGDVWVIGIAPIADFESFLVIYEAVFMALDS